ncbi:MAG: putative toxin-antitoxin system toxin component, PIN family [Syntrophales bacterium]
MLCYRKIKKSKLASTDISEISAIVSEAASEILHKLGPIPNVCRDRNDDMIIARSVDAAADCIVTGGEDLLILEHFNDIVIINPRNFEALFAD